MNKLWYESKVVHKHNARYIDTQKITARGVTYEVGNARRMFFLLFSGKMRVSLMRLGVVAQVCDLCAKGSFGVFSKFVCVVFVFRSSSSCCSTVVVVFLSVVTTSGFSSAGNHMKSGRCFFSPLYLLC